MNFFCKIENHYHNDSLNNRPVDSNSEEVDSYEELQKSYSIEFQSQSYAAFYNTKMEKDKSILTLSVAGLGFLITLINVSSTLSIWEYSIFSITAVLYLICIYFVIKIFDKNADYISTLTGNGDVSDESKKLKRYDSITVKSFYLAIFLSFMLGVSTSIGKQVKGAVMPDKKSSNAVSGVQVLNKGGADAEQLNKSFSGAASMRPSLPVQSTFNQQSNTTQGNQGQNNEQKK